MNNISYGKRVLRFTGNQRPHRRNHINFSDAEPARKKEQHTHRGSPHNSSNEWSQRGKHRVTLAIGAPLGKAESPASLPKRMASGLSLRVHVPARRACPRKSKKPYSLGRVTKNDMMAPKPQSDPIIATVGQRSARLLVSKRMQTEAITTRAVIAMYAVLALGRLTVSFSGKSRIDGADCSTSSQYRDLRAVKVDFVRRPRFPAQGSERAGRLAAIESSMSAPCFARFR